MTRAGLRTAGPRPPGARSGGPQPARVVRGGLAGLVAGTGALVAHHVAGGHAVPAVALVVTGLAMAAGGLLARWRVGAAAALGLAVVVQATSHLLLAGSGGHPHLEHHLGHAGRVTGPVASGTLDGGPAMWLGHLAVALVTAALVRGADRAVLDLLRVLVSWFRPRLRLPVLPLPVARRPHRTALVLLPGPRRAGSTPLTRRGPPVVTRLSLPTP